MSDPNAVMAAIARELPMPWTVEVTFRVKDGREVFTYVAPCKVTAPDQVVSVEVDLGSARLTLDGQVYI